MNQKNWGDKPYHSMDYALKEVYGEKLYRITLNAGLTCPNRDGTVGMGGCTFCSAEGSGDFAGNKCLSITEQLDLGKQILQEKRPVQAFIAYFQAFSNTYAPIPVLRELYEQAISDPQVKILAIATRPDCLDEDVLSLLQQIHAHKPVWIELGLQTIHPNTATAIRRGYPLALFEEKVRRLRLLNIPVIVHVILGLPGETTDDMLQTIEYLNRQNIQGIKLQVLHVLRNTDLAKLYLENPFWIPTKEEYLSLLGQCIARLNPEIVIHRLTGDGPKDLLIAPLWSRKKRTILNQLHQHLKNQNIWQGKEFVPNE